jgi:hypothetical protein
MSALGFRAKQSDSVKDNEAMAALDSIAADGLVSILTDSETQRRASKESFLYKGQGKVWGCEATDFIKFIFGKLYFEHRP